MVWILPYRTRDWCCTYVATSWLTMGKTQFQWQAWMILPLDRGWDCIVTVVQGEPLSVLRNMSCERGFCDETEDETSAVGTWRIMVVSQNEYWSVLVQPEAIHTPKVTLKSSLARWEFTTALPVLHAHLLTILTLAHIERIFLIMWL